MVCVWTDSFFIGLLGNSILSPQSCGQGLKQIVLKTWAQLILCVVAGCNLTLESCSEAFRPKLVRFGRDQVRLKALEVYLYLTNLQLKIPSLTQKCSDTMSAGSPYPAILATLSKRRLYPACFLAKWAPNWACHSSKESSGSLFSNTLSITWFWWELQKKAWGRKNRCMTGSDRALCFWPFVWTPSLFCSLEGHSWSKWDAP